MNNMRTVLSNMAGTYVDLWLVGDRSVGVTVKAMGDSYVTVELGTKTAYISLEHIVAVVPR